MLLFLQVKVSDVSKLAGFSNEINVLASFSNTLKIISFLKKKRLCKLL